MKICLDAGHYGKYNQSPAVPEYYESDMNWKLHLLLKAEMEKYGFEVITTRSKQASDLDLYRRGMTAKGCDLFLSIHSNAVGSYVNEDIDHVSVYRLVDDNTTKVDDISQEVAEKLAPVIAKIMDTKQGYSISTRKSDNDRNGDGIKNDNYYGVLNGCRQANCPGLILEHSFHTQTRATLWLMEDANLEKLAVAEAQAIAEYFGVKESAEEPAEAEKWYRIRKSWDSPGSQLAAYKYLDLAKQACPIGYSVYDWNGNAVYAPRESVSLTIPVLSTGDKGECVGAVQSLLRGYGVTSVGEVDGKYGPKTTAAVTTYQKNNGLTASGVMDGDTWKTILGVAE